MQYGFLARRLTEGERVERRFDMWGQEDTEMAYRLIHSGVKKKFLKMGGVQYHLYHTKASRERLMYHNMVLRKVIIQRTAWCANGINKGMNLAKSI